jgi:tetrapyrrole methylase family protein/MazG family protein
MPAKKNKTLNPKRPNQKLPQDRPFYQLVSIFARLRAPGGCPWDRVQNHQTLTPYLIEEAYEVIEAIEEKDSEKLKEELGDLLGQVLFHAQIAAEAGRFGIDDVIERHASKMKHRHPHVFADTKVRNAKEVLLNWEEIKYKEKKHQRRSALDGIPRSLPALLKAHRMQDKAARLGFDWEHIDGAFDKLNEEMEEFTRAYSKGDKREIKEELGDILFSLVNLARFLNIDPEDALRMTSQKFSDRFRFIEQELARQGRTFKQSSLQELDAIWEQAKKRSRRRKE